jgi:ATPase subunit of ABC transporter with duplicated ATPase domains
MISFSNVNKQYGKQVLFVDASFQLNPGDKVGLVGPNGSGKTTLFRMVVGEETPDEGAVSAPKKLTIGYSAPICFIRVSLSQKRYSSDIVPW